MALVQGGTLVMVETVPTALVMVLRGLEVVVAVPLRIPCWMILYAEVVVGWGFWDKALVALGVLGLKLWDQAQKLEKAALAVGMEALLPRFRA